MLTLHLTFCKLTWPQTSSLLLSLFNLLSSHFLALHKIIILEKITRPSRFPGVPFYDSCSSKIIKSTPFHPPKQLSKPETSTSPSPILTSINQLMSILPC